MAQLVKLISVLSVLFIFQHQLVQVSEAKRSKLKQVKCQLDECQLEPQHFALYSFVKQAVDSNFDLNGKEVVSFLRSVEVLRRRFQVVDGFDSSSNGKALNETTKIKLIKDLLANETLLDALKIFESDDGRALINLYRVPINGVYKNLACGQMRVEDAERATRKLKSQPELSKIFSKVHKNFLKKSAKKCLKHSCTSIDLAMSRLDSVLDQGNKHLAWSEEGRIFPAFSAFASDTNETEVVTPTSPGSENNKDVIPKREFEQQELELCRFFMRTNESDCRASGRELSSIVLINQSRPLDGDEANEGDKLTVSLNDLLKSYSLNMNLTEPEAGMAALSQCKPLKSLLDYNLFALKWYKKEGLIEEHKLNTRTFWCPSLSYWLQLDRLCYELEVALDMQTFVTFHYEIDTKKVQDKNTILVQSNNI